MAWFPFHLAYPIADRNSIRDCSSAEPVPVDELEVRERPAVIFRTHDNTWIEVVVRYLVQPKEAGRVKNRLFKTIMAELNKHPEKVMFPKTNMR